MVRRRPAERTDSAVIGDFEVIQHPPHEPDTIDEVAVPGPADATRCGGDDLLVGEEVLGSPEQQIE